MKYFISIIICVLFISCAPKCENVNFRPNDKNWFDNYNIGDKIIFKSQLNDFDTIFITNKILEKPKGECQLFVSGGYDNAFARLDYEIKKDTFKLLEDYFVQIVANEKKEDAVPVLRLLNMEFSSFHLPNTKASELNPNWKNVYTFNKDNSHTNFNGKYGIIEFEWDKKYGLVSYKNANEEKWVLLKKE